MSTRDHDDQTLITESVEEHAGQYQGEKKVGGVPQWETGVCTDAMDFLAFVLSYEDFQRKCEVEEEEFEGLDMWSSEAREARKGETDTESGQKTQDKPTISVNLFDQNIQQVMTDARQARLALTVKPRAGIANTKTSDYLKGLVRTIQVDSGALEVRLWALERTARVGRGEYMARADFANDGDFDIDIIIERILDQSTVYWDPYSVKADRSDALKCLVSEFVSEGERERRWPDKELLAPDNAWQSEKDNWFPADPKDPKSRRVRIGRFYRVEFGDPRHLAYHPALGKKWLDEMPTAHQNAVLRGEAGTRRKKVEKRIVWEYVIDGTQVLEKNRWFGDFIPVFEIVGKEYYLRGKRRWKGIIANGMEIGRAINVVISSATELAAKMPRVPYIMYAGQDENFEEEWDDVSTKDFNRVHVNAVDVDGKPAPLPQRQPMDVEVQGLMFLLRMLLDLYHSVSGSVSAAQRAVNPYDRSGKAIEALQRQGAAGTSNFLDNMATVTMPYEGKCLLNAIPHYYDREGRVVRVMGEGDTGDEVAIMVKRPFIRDADGMPVGVPCQACGGKGRVGGVLWNVMRNERVCPECQGAKFATKANMPEEFEGQTVEYVDFGEGEFKCVAALDKDFHTKQEEALMGMQALAAAWQDGVPIYADLWVRAMGFSGSGQIADRIRDQNPHAKDEDQFKGVPPRVRQQFTQLKMQHQQAMEALQQAAEIIKGDKIKNAGQKEIAVIKGALQQRIEGLKAQGRVMEKAVDLKGDKELAGLKGSLEMMRQKSEERHEILMQLLKELGAKEQERHSAALHEEAARAAAKDANLGKIVDHALGEHAADSQARRDDVASGRDHLRDRQASAEDGARTEGQARRDHAREQDMTDYEASLTRRQTNLEAHHATKQTTIEADREDQRAAEERKAAANKPKE